MENMPSGEKDPLNKKTKVLEYIKQKLEKARKDFSSLNSEVSYYKDMKPSSGPTSIPNEVRQDGGSDLRDWKVETGVGRYEEQQKDHFTSPETLDELAHLEEFVADLEKDLGEIESGNEQTIEHYWCELNKPAK